MTEIVAEIGASHNRELWRARELVRAAAKAGANAVKFQCWDTMTMDETPIASGPWRGMRLTDLYDRARMPWEWFGPLFDLARSLRLEPFVSVFDVESLAFMESLGCPRYKIASFEITDLALIRAARATGKPLILSTGMATEAEIGDALTASGFWDVTLLKCTSAYPAPVGAANLATISDMRVHFNVPVGLSDHTLGCGAACAAVALGATMIEKHLTLSRAGGGLDDGFASEPQEFAAAVQACREAEAAVGTVSYGPTESEQGSLAFRRSLWTVAPIAKGETIRAERVRALRPATGLPPSTDVVGRTAAVDIPANTPLEESHVRRP